MRQKRDIARISKLILLAACLFLSPRLFAAKLELYWSWDGGWHYKPLRDAADIREAMAAMKPEVAKDLSRVYAELYRQYTDPKSPLNFLLGFNCLPKQKVIFIDTDCQISVGLIAGLYSDEIFVGTFPKVCGLETLDDFLGNIYHELSHIIHNHKVTSTHCSGMPDISPQIRYLWQQAAGEQHSDYTYGHTKPMVAFDEALADAVAAVFAGPEFRVNKTILLMRNLSALRTTNKEYKGACVKPANAVGSEYYVASILKEYMGANRQRVQKLVDALSPESGISFEVFKKYFLQKHPEEAPAFLAAEASHRYILCVR